MRRVNPDDIETLCSRAQKYAQEGDHQAALELYQRLSSLLPGSMEIRMLLGVEHAESGNFEQAIDHFLVCLDVDPTNAALHQMIGLACNELGKNDEALLHFSYVCEQNPENDVAITYLAQTLINKLRMSEAAERLTKALTINPANVLAYNNLARIYKFQGRSLEAFAAYREALELGPQNRVVANNLLLCMNYLYDISPEEVFAEHRMLCNQVYGVDDVSPQPATHSENKKMRIGYVSGDFRNHSVAFFFEPVLLYHDRQLFDIYCYSNDGREDDTTLRFKATMTNWRSIVGLSEERAAELVRLDGIDILVDLSGHSSGNRLGLFALKPAAVQVSWLGYPHSTGLSQMDYYLTDRWCDLPGMTEHLFTEKLVRLPGPFCSYLPPLQFPMVSPPPAVASGIVTFGSFNNFAKMNDELLELWAELLKMVPDSRLLLKAAALGDPDTQRVVLARFHNYGISCDRIALMNTVSSANDHLAMYAQVDIALDTYPYHGTTTTCEALWMGVPVITLAGSTHAARVGVTLLSAVGCPELIAATTADYLHIAVALAKYTDRLSNYRENLRSKMAVSPLMDAVGLVKSVESAYTAMLPLHKVKVMPDMTEDFSKELLTPSEHFQTAKILFTEQRYQECEALYRTLLLRFPLNADLYNSLGTVLDAQGRFSEGSAHYAKALCLCPDFVTARFNQANTLRRLGDNAGCLENLRTVVNAHPGFVDAWQNMAICYMESGMLDDAAQCLEQVIKLGYGSIATLVTLGETCQKIGKDKLSRALECFDNVLKYLPDDVKIINLKGAVLHEMEEYAGAELCFRQALALDPLNVWVMNNLGLTLLASVRPEAAVEIFDQALALEPMNGSVHFNRGMARLLIGDFSSGWAGYEYRFEKLEPVFLPALNIPRWSGAQLEGRTLLVRSEQGYGDCIQFARYLSLLESCGGRVVLECMDHQISPLFYGLPGVDALMVRGESVPAADFQIPLASLPHFFNTDLASIPYPEGYLASGRKEREIWQPLVDIEAKGTALKVGLVWGGRDTRLNANRSLPFSCLAPLFEVKGIRWYSLQTGSDIIQIRMAGDTAVDIGSRIIDFADTAAIIGCLDLVITIDTAVAHLGGALGVPTWLLLKASPDWRWLLGREDSPWYNSLRLFRQVTPGDWKPVIASVADALTERCTYKKKG